MAERTPTRRWLYGSTFAVLLLATALTAPAAAGAAALGSHRSTQHAKTRHFSLSGLVQAKGNGKVAVYVAKGKIGGVRLHKVVESVAISQVRSKHHKSPTRTKKHTGRKSHSLSSHRAAHHSRKPLVVGDIVRLVGKTVEHNGKTSLLATAESIINTHSAAVLGTVSSVTVGTTTSTLVVNSEASLNGGSITGSSGSLSVDATNAAVYVDGALGQLSNLVSGETVVVIGESYNGSMVAAAVLAFTAVPSVVWGHLTQVSGSTLEVANDSGQTPIDASSATIFLNGVSGASVSQLNNGSFVLAIGPSGTNPLQAAMIFDFNRGDDHPTGDNGDQGSGHNRSVSLFGTVQSVSGSNVVISRGQSTSGQSQGDHLRPADGGDTVNVDASSATVSLDGNASVLGTLVPGDTVMVLGSANDQNVTATALYAYDNAPNIVSGLAGSITGTGFTVSGEDNASTAVDASSAAFYLDGASSTLASLGNDDLVVAFGTTSSTGLTATAVFAFNGSSDS